ncbi:MAG: hypothetical protein DWQ01_11355 [Planctomycetota bacterium]|nr:MAG: hypothetical protein DWQ01_11355 [Planctomycetota bacterium]
MRGLLFLVFALASASGLVGAYRAFSQFLAGRWGDYGDGQLFWLVWAEDPGRRRLIQAGVAAAVVVAVYFFAKKSRLRPLHPLVWVVERVGHPLVAALALVVALLPQIVAPMVRPDAAGKPSVVFILLDTVRLDAMGWGGNPLPATPRMDQLAAQGASYRQAISQASWTKPSVGSLLTGLNPSRHLAIGRPRFRWYDTLEGEQRTLAEAFAAAGYKTAAVSTNPNIKPAYGFHQGFFKFVEETTYDADQVLEVAEGWLADQSDPFFLYLHFNDAHYPYDPIAPYDGTFDHTQSDAHLDGATEGQFRLGDLEFSEEDVEHMRLAYLEEVAYLDDRVGRFVEKLHRERDDVFVVIVADHGEEFLEHGDLGHGHSLYDELLKVPLQFSWSPGMAQANQPLVSGSFDQQVRLIDVAPTLLDLAELEWPAEALPLDGESLLPMLLDPSKAGGDRPAFSETESPGSPRSGMAGALRSWREPGWKFIQTDPFGDKSGRYWLFDLGQDPGETTNLAATAPELREYNDRMQSSGWLIRKEIPAPSLNSGAPELDPALKELGYADHAGDSIPPEKLTFAPGSVKWVDREKLRKQD